MSFLFPLYNFPDNNFVRGEGAYLFDDKGARFLDFTSGIGVNALGHAAPPLVEALCLQAQTLWHVSNLFSHGGQEKVAQQLVRHSFADRAFFCNSGTEAIEMGIKLVRRYHQNRGDDGRYRIISMHGSFHGRSMAAVSASGVQSSMLEGFLPPLSGFDQVNFGSIDEVRRALSDETAAILLEPLQGEGGIHVASHDYLRDLRALADEAGALLFFDEVQCGMGRTGKLFFHEWSGVTPDVMASAKGLGGGFPVGALLAREEIAAVMTKGAHGSTFGGNPLAMAVADKIMSIIAEPSFLQEVARLGAKLKDAMMKIARNYPSIMGEVRGEGLMLGVPILHKRDEMIQELREHHLLTVGARGNIIRLLPPLTIEDSHIDECVHAFATVCAQRQKKS